jgi:hypothetical protein
MRNAVVEWVTICLTTLGVTACAGSEPGSIAFATPERFDIAFVETSPSPMHLRYMSDAGNLSSPVYLPNDLEVWYSVSNAISWSPDGDFIAVAAKRPGGDASIYVMRPGGGDLQQITSDAAWDDEPDWSPDGTRILFKTDRNALGEGSVSYDIYIHDLTTGVETRVTPTSGNYLGPVWSPESMRIAYVEVLGFGEGGQIMIHDLATNAATPIGGIQGDLIPQGLHWSPSVDQLLFWEFYSTDVYRIHTDGSGLANLTTNLFDDEWSISVDPSWYDDSRVLFASAYWDESGNSHRGIYRMTPTGAGATSIALIGETPVLEHNPVRRFAATDLPDLVVSFHSDGLDDSDPSIPLYQVEFKIRNIGLAPSSEALIYVDAINPNPSSGENEIQLQKSVELRPLDSGAETIRLTVAFELAEMFANGVSLVRITADSKNQVVEAFEINNTAELNFP